MNVTYRQFCSEWGEVKEIQGRHIRFMAQVNKKEILSAMRYPGCHRDFPFLYPAPKIPQDVY